MTDARETAKPCNVSFVVEVSRGKHSAYVSWVEALEAALVLREDSPEARIGLVTPYKNSVADSKRELAV